MENMSGSSVPMLPMVRPSMLTPGAPTGTMGLYPRPTPFFDSLPSSADEARRRGVDNDQGLSKSMGWITTNVILAEWDEGLENEIFNGQFIFVAALDHGAVFPDTHRDIMKSQIPALTLRHVNEYLRVGYQAIKRAFQGSMPIKQEFTDDQLQLMSDTPVCNWHRLEFIDDRIRASDSNSLANQLIFLSEPMAVARFNPFGWVDGQVPGEGRLKQVAIRRAGTMEDVENIWGPDVQPGDSLYFIWRRIYDFSTGEWEQLALVPWHGIDAPSIADRTYMDFVGNTTVGCAIRIGTVDRFTQADGLRMEDLPQLIGIKRCTLPRVKIGPEPGCLRITALGSKNRLPWLF